MTVVDRATITVDPDPSIVGANLVVALGAAGPLETGQAETLTATLTDGLGAPIRNFVVHATVAGANPVATHAAHRTQRRRDVHLPGREGRHGRAPRDRDRVDAPPRLGDFALRAVDPAGDRRRRS